MLRIYASQAAWRELLGRARVLKFRQRRAVGNGPRSARGRCGRSPHAKPPAVASCDPCLTHPESPCLSRLSNAEMPRLGGIPSHDKAAGRADGQLRARAKAPSTLGGLPTRPEGGRSLRKRPRWATAPALCAPCWCSTPASSLGTGTWRPGGWVRWGGGGVAARQLCMPRLGLPPPQCAR